MLDNLCFYNHYGNGDIFESREFVREIITKFPADNYIYYIARPPRLMLDIPEILTDNVNFPPFLSNGNAFQRVNNDLYINTWIGRDSKYVLPGSACTLEKLYEMYNDILGEINGSKLDKEPIDYLTTVNYSLFDISKINEFMESNLNSKKVYINNGLVYSLQADNFSMNDSIVRLADKYKNILFFTSDLVYIDRDNIINANDFTQSSVNLMELSYLSTFCDMIIGKNSGPHVVTWTRENCFSNKINITFSYKKECEHFVYSTPITMKKYWTSSTDAFTFIDDIIGKELV